MFGFFKESLKRSLPSPVWDRFRSDWWRYLRPLTVDYCPLQLPWFPSARFSDPSANLHRMALRFQWRNEWSATTTFALIAASVFWPFKALNEVVSRLFALGPIIRRMHGIGIGRQLMDMCWLVFHENVPATYYYKYRLYDPENARLARFYLFESEMGILYPILAAGRPSDVTLRWKHHFFQACRNHRLPTAETIAVFARGTLETWHGSTPNRLPSMDIVIKPVDLACGRGFETWLYRKETQTWNNNQWQFDEQGIMDYAASKSHSHPHLIQIRLQNHRVLQQLCGTGLSTIRVITFQRSKLEYGVLLACIRMPTGEMSVDNFEAGGIAAPIDLETGMIGSAVAKDVCRGRFDIHPDSGAWIRGATIPFFSEAVDLTLSAHRCFPSNPFVGWDVAVTATGPILLEANPDWCVELAQIAMNKPLGTTEYPRLFFKHLVESQTGHVNHSTVPA